MDEKIHVIAKDGLALVGTAFHKLEGICRSTFVTDNIFSFCDFVKKDIDGRDQVIYFNESKIIVYDELMDYEDDARAVCELKKSPYLTTLQDLIGAKLGFESMENVLTMLKPFLDKNGKSVLDFCTNAQINKIVKVARSKDNSGNLNLNISRQSGQDDYQCPKTISFEIPILNHIDDKEKIEFDMFLGFKDGADSVSIELWFNNLNFQNQIDEFRKKIVLRELESIELPKFWGELKLQKLTDAWKYKEHGI